MITYNGQQVIIKPLNNNSAMLVAHVKQQENGPAQIVVNNTASAESGADGVAGTSTEQDATPGPSAEQRVSKTITAQLVQSAEGPKFILQGLGTNELTPQQLNEIKQHVMKGKISYNYN